MPVDHGKYEIVGFYGVFQLECERNVPLGHRKRDDVYFRADPKFHLQEDMGTCHNAAEIEKLVDGGSLTMLPHPITMIDNAAVLYATYSFLMNVPFLDCQRPIISFDESSLSWQELNTIPKTFITCASAETIGKLMDYWGDELRQSTELQLREYYRTEDDQFLERGRELADSGLCAAHGHNLRKNLYLAWALLRKEEPGVISGMWGKFICNEFPEFTKDGFDKQVRALEARLKGAEE